MTWRAVITGPARTAARLCGARSRGIAALEFALVAPMIVVMFIGSFQILNAVTAYRKLTDTTVELANITCQYTTMGQTDVNTVLNAAATIMAPYSTVPMSIILSEVGTDSNGNATVTWSKAYQTTPLAQGSSVNMPAGFDSPNSHYIVVQSTYSFTPVVGQSFVGTIPLAKEVVMLPRASSSIPYTN